MRISDWSSDVCSSDLARAAITAWALLGGLVLVAVVLINVLSVIGGVVWRPFPGDFEMTEIGIAVAAFAFLPYCHLTGANVNADIFTIGRVSCRERVCQSM